MLLTKSFKKSSVRKLATSMTKHLQPKYLVIKVTYQCATQAEQL